MPLEHQGQVVVLGRGWDAFPADTGEEARGHWEVGTRGAPEAPLPTPLPRPASPGISCSHLNPASSTRGSRRVSENYKAMANSLHHPGHGDPGHTGH